MCDRSWVVSETSAISALADAAPEATQTGAVPVGSTLNSLLVGNWHHELFERLRWEELMYGCAVFLALSTVAWLLVTEFARRSGFPLSRRLRIGVSAGLLLISFGVYFSFLNPNVRHKDYFHPDQVYHHYLGAKYFTELGYSHIYTCTAVAESELHGSDSVAHKKFRELQHGNIVRRIEHTNNLSEPDRCKQHFSDERWRAFKKDLEYIKSASPEDDWDRMKQGHGYSASPVWTMTGRWLAQQGIVSIETFQQLAAIDVGLQLGAFALLVWAFGWEIAAATAVFWGTSGVANFSWTGGAFLSQDGFFLLVASLCLAKKRRYTLSGAALTWSALLRLFPAISLIAVIGLTAVHYLQHRRIATSHRRFLLGAVLATALLVPASIAATGANAYPAYLQHLQTQRAAPTLNQMGLEVALAHSWSSRLRFTQDDTLPDPLEDWGATHTTNARTLLPLQLLLSLAIVAGLLAYFRRGPPLWVVLPLSLPLIFSVTNMACYSYVGLLLLVPLMRLNRALAIPSLLAAAASQVLLSQFYWLDDRYAALSYLYLAVTLMPLAVLLRPERLLGRLAWTWSKRFARR